jgi:hypothetical protein
VSVATDRLKRLFGEGTRDQVSAHRDAAREEKRKQDCAEATGLDVVNTGLRMDQRRIDRAFLDAAPGGLLQKLRYKAAEAWAVGR